MTQSRFPSLRARCWALALLCFALVSFSSALSAQPKEQFEASYDFALHDWHALDQTDGAVTLHRFRLEPKTGRIDRSVLFRSKGQEYVRTIVFQMEYTNESSSKWDAKVEVAWLDSEGEVIDGFTATDSLSKKSARKIFSVSLPTLAYGLEQAETLRVQIHFTP